MSAIGSERSSRGADGVGRSIAPTERPAAVAAALQERAQP